MNVIFYHFLLTTCGWYEVIERFSNDCRKINTKVITLTNHNRSKQRDEPIRISLQLPTTCSKRGKKRAYKMRLVLVLVLVLLLNGTKTGATFLSQSLSVA